MLRTRQDPLEPPQTGLNPQPPRRVVVTTGASTVNPGYHRLNPQPPRRVVVTRSASAGHVGTHWFKSSTTPEGSCYENV